MYRSLGQHYTYGVMEYDDILGIPKSDIPDSATVWCEDNHRVWWYASKHGIWTNNDCVMLQNREASAAKGDIVRQDTADLVVEKETQSGNSAKPLGIILDVNTETNMCSVAFTGYYKAKSGNTIIAGRGANVDATPDGTLNGGISSDGSTTKGNIGVCAEDGVSGDRLWVHICVKREYF